jgi:SAM-dependent methyltransferase
MEFSRRDFVKFLPTLMALGFMPRALLAATAAEATPGHSGYNFKYIYGNEKLRSEFHLFLQNVYSLYPDPAAHKLIIGLTSTLESDEEIYRQLQKRFPDIKPFLSIFRKSVPALHKQKKEMQEQTAKLIKDMKKVNGYVEIGTTGRYYEGIKDCVKVRGKTYILNTDGPTYNPGDMVDRGHLVKIGKFVQMGDYDPVAAKDIAGESVDLVSNYIGFHHAPPDKRDAFIESVGRTLRPGGRLVLRDHDADSEQMKFMAALAHDVFNAGLDISWEKNLAETRNFASIGEIAEKLDSYGLKPQESRLLQPGDPTANTLMVFVKT